MEYQKIVNYLHDAEKHHSKCKTRKWIEVNNEIRRSYSGILKSNAIIHFQNQVCVITCLLNGK